MKYSKEKALQTIAFAVIIFALAFAYGQYMLALEHNRQIILRCVLKEVNEAVDYDACMRLWDPFLVPFAPQKHGV